MLWLNRPYAGQQSEIRVVEEDGTEVAIVIVRTEQGLEIEVQRLENDPQVTFMVP